jgi:hypothetical protein
MSELIKSEAEKEYSKISMLIVSASETDFTRIADSADCFEIKEFTLIGNGVAQEAKKSEIQDQFEFLGLI